MQASVMMLTLLASDRAIADGKNLPVSETIQFDAARPVRMGDGCPYPTRGAVERKSGTYTFTLRGGDVGRCPGDDQRNYGSDFRERVMINGIDYPKRVNGYRFSALVRFDPETRSADDTVFFEVHQWRTPECSCYPIIMIYMMADGTLEAETSSHSETSYRRRQLPGWNRSDFEAGWVEFAVDVSTVEGVQPATVFLGGNLVYSEPTLVYAAGAVCPHFGLYRPGRSQSSNPTDRVFFKDMRVAGFKWPVCARSLRSHGFFQEGVLKRMSQLREDATTRLALILTAVAGPAYAQAVDGMYRPDQPWAESWTCDPDDLGMDGGALGIMDGKLYGLENTCEIVSPTESNGGVRFEAVCSAEGETYRTEYFVEPTATGITLTRDGETVAWRRCEQQATSTGNVWVSGFAMGVTEASTSDGNGNSLTMSCQEGMNGQVYLTLDAQPAMGDVRFDVDGQSFELSSWAEGGRLNVECRACADNYMALGEALRAGSQVTITAANNQATLSLNGSADALSPEPCVPEGW